MARGRAGRVKGIRNQFYVRCSGCGQMTQQRGLCDTCRREQEQQKKRSSSWGGGREDAQEGEDES